MDSGNKFGQEYTAEEDALLKRLKEVDKATWHDMPKHFDGRTAASLQTPYSDKLKGRVVPASSPSPAATKAPAPGSAAIPSQLQSGQLLGLRSPGTDTLTKTMP